MTRPAAIVEGDVREHLANLAGEGYRAVLADPPWGFRTWDSRRIAPHRGGDEPYRTMTDGEIAQLPVGGVAGRDAVLFLWTISSHVPQSIEIARGWGFEPRSIAFVWVKTREGAAAQGFFGLDDVVAPVTRVGMGYWTRQEAEICLLATRGRPRRRARDVRQVVFAPRREHSRKPDEVRARIERLVDGPYLELFGRAPRPGWTVVGDEATRFAEVAS